MATPSFNPAITEQHAIIIEGVLAQLARIAGDKTSLFQNVIHDVNLALLSANGGSFQEILALAQESIQDIALEQKRIRNIIEQALQIVEVSQTWTPSGGFSS